MNYFKHYEKLIEKHGHKTQPSKGYHERHHIQPKCLGGGDESDNLVFLSARCHLLAHWLLSKTFDDVRELKLAYATMCSRRRVRVTTIMHKAAKNATSGDNSMHARAVVTPKGTFSTVTSAAKAHGVSKAIISKKAGSKSMLHRGYYWVDEVIVGDVADGRNAHHLRKRVSTPYGNFESVREAGRVLGIHHSTISKRIRRGDEGYSYI